MSEPLSILNENYARLEGPCFLHKLIEWQRNASALDFLRVNGQREQYSYQELQKCVLSLASAVQDASTAVELQSKYYRRIVPVLVPQSPGLYISILAILEADAAFCPINLDSPPDRIKFVIGDVSAVVVITTREYEHLMTWEGGPRVILVEEFPAVPQHYDSPNIMSPQLRQSGDLAYVMYTSGSSGTPKGVAVSHLAASQSLLAHDKHIPRFKRFLQFAAPSFDVSVFEIFFPFFRGVTLVGCSRARMLNDLTGTINQLEVDGVELTPTVVSTLLQRRSSVPGLKVLLTIGEMLTRPVVGEFGKSDEFDGVLYAMYGPTEAAIHCTVKPNMRSDAKCTDIGVPFDTVSAYIASAKRSVDQDGDIHILPVGQTGELVLGGLQVAECYLNRAEQNKAAFVNVRGQRAYRTGDKGRITSAGSIEILGRITSGQLKLRGQRVELGEIEEAVYKHSGVIIAVASVLNGILIVFVLSQEPQMAPEDVLKTCSSWLPPFMIPNEVIILTAFPYMSSGKVDKRKLEADFESQQNDAKNTPQSWNSKTEEAVAKAIRDTLGVEARSTTRLAGIGLDSLVAIRLASILRSSGYNVSAVDILKAENVPALAYACYLSLVDQKSADARHVQSTNFKDLIPQWSEMSREHVGLDEVEYIMPCTPLQDAMITGSAIEVGAYKNRVMLQLTTTANLKEAQKAMQTLANLNPLLRTGFIPLQTDHSTFSQMVRKKLPLSQVEVVKDFSDDVATLQSLSLLHPLRIQLRRNQQHTQVLLHIHHAIYDAWSLDLLLDDLDAILSGRSVQGRPSFRDVVDWHWRENSSDNICLLKNYWKDHLSQLEVLHLPSYETMNSVDRQLNIVSLETSIVTQEVMETAHTLFVSPQSIFQAAFAFILSSYLGSLDVCFGTVFSGRTVSIKGIENIAGPCLATLPTRLDLETVSTLREMVERLSSINRKHLEYISLPLRLIKQACGIELGQMLFDSLLVWQQTLEDYEHTRDQVTLIDSNDFLEFNLTLEIVPKRGNITLKANYQRTIFPSHQVDLLLQQIEQLVMIIIKSPEMSLNHAGQAFTNDLLSIENPTPQANFDSKTLTSTIEQLALSLPDRTAIKFATRIEANVAEIQRLSYYELNQQANKIAHHLMSYKILPDNLICIIMDKSMELYVSILGAIKCGAGYLPITPDTPLDRICQILSQANPRLVLCQSSLGRDLKTTTRTSIIFIDQLDYSTLQSENPRLRSTVENLAYCVFTSGSTGTPKGVLITRGNLMSNLEVLAELYPGVRSNFQSEDVMFLQSCSQAFDVSVFEIFFTWHIGACLCSAVKDVLFRDIELAINSLQVTHLSLTPTVAALVNPQNVPGVRFLVTAGEAVTGKVFNSWANNGLWQGYGPSETTNICTVRPNVTAHHHINNIGPPLSNTSAFVLNPANDFSLVLRGGEGEFCFGGAQVGKGYLDPAQVVGKFIEHPLYGRLYRSGDHGRLLPDGSLSFSGRKDDQVKLRGQRIELGEISSLLLKSPEVRDCVTLVVEDETRVEKRLVTFLIPQHTSTLEFSDLKMDTSRIEMLFSSLYSALPGYMVPSALIPVSSMPWTAQGKIDSRRLIQHYRSLPINYLDKASLYRRAYIEPQWSGIEKKIAQRVATAANVSLAEIVPETSFFSVGIDSVSAISLARALREDLGLNVQISDILKYSSVSRLAYRASLIGNPGSGTTGIDSKEFGNMSRFLSVTEDEFARDGRSIKCSMPCTPLQEAMLSADEISSHESYKNRILLEIKVSIESFKIVWTQMVERHEILRTCFVKTNHPRFAYAQVIMKEFITSWDMQMPLGNDRDTSISGSKPTQLSTSKYQPPYSIEFRTLPESKQILLSLHHAVYDAVALSILFEEIEIALRNGVLPPPVSFAPFIEYVRAYRFEEADTYWDKLLSGFKPIEIIPEALGTSTKRNFVSRMKSELSLSWIEAKVKNYDTSLLSVCQASWISLLSIYLQESDICIGNVVSGRTVPVNNIDRLVAPCFNTIPVRVKGLHELSFIELFRELQAQNINSMPFQLTPLRRIQSRLNTEGMKLFNTLLILQQPAKSLDPSIWSLLEDEGTMDVPIVIELVPQRDSNALNILLHCRQEQLSHEESTLMLSGFDSVLRKSLVNPRYRISSALPYDESNALIRCKVMDRPNPVKSESQLLETMNPVQAKIRDIFAIFTEVPEAKIHLQTSIYRLGLDSISAVQVAACLRKEGLQVMASDVLQHPNIERLAIYLNETQEHLVKKSGPYSFGSFHEKHYMNIRHKLGLSPHNVTVRPCTPVQCGMLAQSIHSDGLEYINSFSLELGSGVSLSKMRDAWEFAMNKHEMLRTGFLETEDSKYPFAMITYNQGDFDLPWNANPGNDSEKCRDADFLLRRPWRLDASYTNAMSRIKFTAHHAIYDAHSLDMILSDVADFHNSKSPLSSTSHLSISPLLGAILDVTDQNKDTRKQFWSEETKLTVTHFPDLTPLREKNGEVIVEEMFSRLSVSQLEQLCRQREVSILAAGQATWGRLLSAYVGDPSVTFGLTLSGQSIIGDLDQVAFPTIVTLPVGCHIMGTNMELLNSIMRYNTQLHEHQFTPLTSIQGWTGHTGENIFDTLLAYQKIETNANMVQRPWKVVDEEARVEYGLSIELQPTELGAFRHRLTFQTNLVPAKQANIMLQQFDALLFDTLQNPEKQCASLMSFSQNLLSITPAAEPNLPSPVGLLHQFVEMQARIIPNRIALEFTPKFGTDFRGPLSWNFEQLSREGNRIANLLLRRYASVGDLIAISFDKCPEASFAILGILKAGCAFVAIDPNAPPDRMKFIMDDSRASIILTTGYLTQHLKEIFGVNGNIEVIDTGCLNPNLAESSPNLRADIRPENICYCLYTSGTTGTPKGCEITHENVVQAMMSFTKLFDGHWTEKSKWLQFASFHFDVSVLEQFWPWSVGICVASAPRDLLFQDMPETIKRIGITHIDLTPSLARLLHPDDVPSLTKGVFITGGEQLKQEILDTWGNHHCIYNGYGPTEATIGVTMYPRVPKNGKPSNIGSQFLNVGSYVFRPGTSQPVLRGAVGELCVSGKLVGKGYLNRPELTKERFPHLDNFGERVYRTGDLVRILHDGSFLFLGRADDQVKLRGQRLELGEINSIVKKQVDGLQDVVTLVVRHKNQQKEQLVTFFVPNPKGQRAIPTGELIIRIRDACKRGLPSYMVPTYIIYLDRLPLSANNKVELKQLAKKFSDMSVGDLKALDTITKAHKDWTTQEQAVLDSLCEILMVDKKELACGGSIFEYGIDSISVVAFTRSLQRAGYKKATPSVVMRNTLIDNLVSAIAPNLESDKASFHKALIASQNIIAFTHRNIVAVAAELGISPADIECLAPCTPTQEGMIYRFLSSSRDLYFTTFGFNLDKSVDETRLRTAFSTVARRLQILRTKLVLTNDGCAQAVLKEVDIDWQNSHSRDSSGKALDNHAEDRSQEVAYIDKLEALAKPWRVVITKSGPTNTMYLTLFHGLYDGISFPMMLRLIYQQYHMVSNIDWGPAFHSVLPYGPLAPLYEAEPFWKNTLDGWTPCPVPKLIGLVQERDNKTSSSLGGSRQLGGLRQKLGVTYQSLLQAALCVVLREFLGPNISFGFVTSGRVIDFDSAENIVGPLLNTVPFYMALEPKTTWKDLIRACHEYNLRMLPYQYTALKDIQNWCSTGKPLFDILFVFQQENNNSFNIEGFWEALPTNSVVDYPLAFEAQLVNDGTITLEIVGHEDIIDENATSYLWNRFEIVLQAMRQLDREAFSDPSEPIKQNVKLAQENIKIGLPKGDAVSVFKWSSEAEQIRKEITLLSGTSDVDERTSIFELGLDSIDMIKLVSRLKASGIYITVSSLLTSQTIENMLYEISATPYSSAETRVAIHTYEQQLTSYLTSMNIFSAEFITALPATPLQEGMITEMIASEYTRYFNHEIFRVPGHVHMEKLKSAWDVVISQNDILRTRFVEIDSVEFPMSFAQVINRMRKSYWTNAPTTIGLKLDAMMADVIQNAIETAKMGGLLHLQCFNHEKDHYFVFSISHALYDGWSLRTLHDDVWKAYHGDVVTRPDIRPTLERILNSGQPDEVNFWKASMNGLQRSKFPIRQQVDDNRVMVHRRERISSHTLEDTQRFCRSVGTSLQTIGQTVWAVLLATLLKRLDIVFGMVLSCRDSDESNELMFPLMNTVAIRPVIHGSIVEMLRHMQNRGNLIRRYQHFPLRKTRALAEVPDDQLFDSLFIFQGRTESSLSKHHKLYESVDSVSELEFAVCVEMEIVKDSIIWRTACKDSVLSANETDLLLGKLDQVLEMMIRDPSIPTISVSVNGVSICGMEPFHQEIAVYKEQDCLRASSNSYITWTDRDKLLRRVLVEVARCPAEQIHKDRTLFSLGLDSISAIKVSSILKRHNINLTVSELTGNTIGGMIEIINKNPSESVRLNDGIWQFLINSMKHVDRENMIRGAGLDPSEIEDVLPVTAGQAYMIARSQLSAGTLFASRFTYQLTKKLSVLALENAWRVLVRAHPILRTVFCITGRAKPLAVQIVKKQDSRIQEVISSYAANTISLRTPLFLSTEQRGNDQFLHFDIHHALYDGISLPLLLDNLEQLFARPRGFLPIDTRFRQFVARSVYQGNDQANGRSKFWTEYLRKSTTLKPKNYESSENPKALEVFEPNNHVAMLTVIAQRAGVSVDAVLLAAFSKVYCELIKTRNGEPNPEAELINIPQEVIFGIYLANRGSYGEDFSTLIAPTLNILPIRADASRNLIEIAKAVQYDLQQLGGANIIGSSLAEIYEWTGVQVNCFVNILKASVPDAPLMVHGDFKLTNQDGPRRKRAEVLERHGDDQLRIEAEGSLGEAHKAYMPSVDVEMSIKNDDRGTWLDVGVFALCKYLDINEARNVIEGIKLQLRNLE